MISPRGVLRGQTDEAIAAAALEMEFSPPPPHHDDGLGRAGDGKGTGPSPFGRNALGRAGETIGIENCVLVPMVENVGGGGGGGGRKPLPESAMRFRAPTLGRS